MTAQNPARLRLAELDGDDGPRVPVVSILGVSDGDEPEIDAWSIPASAVEDVVALAMEEGRRG